MKNQSKQQSKYKCVIGCKDKATEKCPYCEEYFCETHIKPKEAGLIHLSDINRFTEDDNNNHPCLNYNIFLEAEEKNRDKEFVEALDRMKGKIPPEGKKKKEKEVLLIDYTNRHKKKKNSFLKRVVNKFKKTPEYN